MSKVNSALECVVPALWIVLILIFIVSVTSAIKRNSDDIERLKATCGETK